MRSVPRGAPASLSVYLLHGAVLWTSYSLWIGSGRAVVVWLADTAISALAGLAWGLVIVGVVLNVLFLIVVVGG